MIGRETEEHVKELPISQAVKVGNRVYVGGIHPIIDGEVDESFPEQARIIFARAVATLDHFGFTVADIVFVTAYLRRMSDYEAFNELYGRFVSPPYPARKVITTDFAHESVLVELELLVEHGEKQYCSYAVSNSAGKTFAG